MMIIGVDPGETTGICILHVDEINEKVTNIEDFEFDLFEVGKLFSNIIDYNKDKFTIVYERANKFQASGHLSSEVIGIVKHYANLLEAKIYGQSASDAKRLVSNSVLKRANILPRGVHARDAARHALYYIITQLNWLTSVLKGD